MRFFIIPKRMFRKQNEGEKIKRKFYKKKGFILTASFAVVLVGFALFVLYKANRVPSVSFCEGVGKFRLEAYSQEDRERFFEQFSYKAQEVKAEEITIPCQSEQFEEYNKLQKSQGLDLMPYCGKQARMYTMKLSCEKNIEEEELFGFLIVYKDRVVAAHITDCVYPACVKSLTG